MHRIVVDAMGGDNAPDEIVQGAAEASLQLSSAEIILVGDSAALGRVLPRMRHDGARVRVHHAPTRIEMDEKPAEALAAKPDASIAVAADLVARGEGDALVSAGNTGASVLACARRWPMLDGVRRAALAAVYPTELRRGEKDDPFSLILDVGATIDATAECEALGRAAGLPLADGMVARATAFFAAVGDHRPSVVRDPGELPWVLGALLCRADELRQPTPALARIAALVAQHSTTVH